MEKQKKQSELLFEQWLKIEVIYLVEADKVEFAFEIVAPNSAIVLQTQLLMSTTYSSVLIFLYSSSWGLIGIDLSFWKKKHGKEVWHNLDETVTH